jgi:hypothetical protein
MKAASTPGKEVGRSMSVDDLVKDAFAARAVPTSSTWDVRRASCLDEILSGGVRRRRSRRDARIALPVLAIAGIILATVLLQGPGTGASAASVVFNRAALAVLSAPVTKLGPNQYLYSETRSLFEATAYSPIAGTSSGTLRSVAQATFTETRQIWLDSAGLGRYELTRSPLQFVSPEDQAAWAASPAARFWQITHPSSQAGPQVERVTTEVGGLPTDPNTLAALITKGRTGTPVDTVPSGPESTFERAARLVVGPNRGMSRTLESSLYEVLAMQHGAFVQTGVTSHSGAKGTAVSIRVASPNTVDRIIIDPTTGAPLEVDSVPFGPTITVSHGKAQKSSCVTVSCQAQSSNQGRVRVGPTSTIVASPVVVNSEYSTTRASQ